MGSYKMGDWRFSSRMPCFSTYPVSISVSAPSPVTLQAVPKLSCRAKMASINACLLYTSFANYIASEDIEDSGAKYFLTGYNTGRGPTLLPGDSQAYHLWAEYTSPYVEKHSREMDRLRDRLPRDDRWRCFLLLDGDHQLLGYTMMDLSLIHI